jgi:peptidyl-prolyl cis-trans isomerase B (cyclophilin B)
LTKGSSAITIGPFAETGPCRLPRWERAGGSFQPEEKNAMTPTLRLLVSLAPLLLLASVCFPVLASGMAHAADLAFSARPALDGDGGVALGDGIPVLITVTNNGDAPAEVTGLEFGRGSVTYEVTMGVGTREEPIAFTATRIPGGVYRPETPKPVTIEPGRTLETTVTGPVALVPGTMRITPVLWDTTELEPIEVAVGGEGSELRLAMTWTDAGRLEAELYPEVAPNTVTNIALLVRNDFYDGLTSHRIIRNFMIQAGCPEGTGTGGPGFSLPEEFNRIHHGPGILSMARSQHEDSAGSQFFIMHGDVPQLDEQYTVFGKVVEGMETVEALANTPVTRSAQGEMSKPTPPPVLESMTLVTAGAEAAQ